MSQKRPIEKDIAYGASFAFGFAASFLADVTVSVSCVAGLVSVAFAFVMIALYDSVQFHGIGRVVYDSVLTYSLTALILIAVNFYFDLQPWEDLKICMLVGLPVIPLATAINLRPRTVLKQHHFRD